MKNMYKKKNIPWNKGKPGYSTSLKGQKRSKVVRERMSEAHKGQTAWNKGKKHSKETKAKMKAAWDYKKHVTKKIKEKISIAFRGNKNPNWKGGISFEPYSVDWTKTLRRSIRERDHYICQLCNQYGNTIHHIDYDKKNCDPKNLINLCKSCNSKVNFNRKYWVKYFMKLLKIKGVYYVKS